jgi:hypothetical protein
MSVSGPILNQIPADATHIKLIEGEKPADLLPLVKVIGKLKIEINSLKKVGE